MFKKTISVILLSSMLFYSISGAGLRDDIYASQNFVVPGGLLKRFRDGELEVFPVKRSEGPIPEDPGLAAFRIFRRRNKQKKNYKLQGLNHPANVLNI